MLCQVLRVVEVKRNMTLRFYMLRIMPVGLFMALTLHFGNTVYLYLTVAFIQMLKVRGAWRTSECLAWKAIFLLHVGQQGVCQWLHATFGTMRSARALYNCSCLQALDCFALLVCSCAVPVVSHASNVHLCSKGFGNLPCAHIYC